MKHSSCVVNSKFGIPKFVCIISEFLHPRFLFPHSSRFTRLNSVVIPPNRCAAAAVPSRKLQEMEASSESERSKGTVKLQAIEATPETFAEYGQIVEASPDGEDFGPGDAQLDLSRGIPRFYIMHIENRPLKFSTITHHASVTQCLGSIGGRVWYLGVAKPSIVDANGSDEDAAQQIVRSSCGHFFVPPAVDDVRVFKISGSKFIKLHIGTWHAGPLFKENAMDFYNLELNNTNVVDHTTHNFKRENGVSFVIDD